MHVRISIKNGYGIKTAENWHKIVSWRKNFANRDVGNGKDGNPGLWRWQRVKKPRITITELHVCQNCGNSKDGNPEPSQTMISDTPLTLIIISHHNSISIFN